MVEQELKSKHTINLNLSKFIFT